MARGPRTAARVTVPFDRPTFERLERFRTSRAVGGAAPGHAPIVRALVGLALDALDRERPALSADAGRDDLLRELGFQPAPARNGGASCEPPARVGEGGAS